MCGEKVKRRGKSSPFRWRHREHGKPHGVKVHTGRMHRLMRCGRVERLSVEVIQRPDK